MSAKSRMITDDDDDDGRGSPTHWKADKFESY